MATPIAFQPFKAAAFNGSHNFATAQLKVALVNSDPSVAFDELADLTEISYTNCSSRNITTTSSTQTAGAYKLVLQNLVLTASGGNVGPFTHVVVYDDTSTGDKLICKIPVGSTITMTTGQTFTINFAGVSGLINA